MPKDNKLILCARCNNFLSDSDVYCRICGSKREEVEYDPEKIEIQCIYGPPPINRKHICHECNYNWTSCQMIDKEKYCPKCGSNVEVIEDHEPF